ncbi:MAG: hypothetical protein PWR32_354 [Candidatus Woesearchaeota archaeon]|nr:hypothetical protein [Candidatus Woesearchaeota archaeon]
MSLDTKVDKEYSKKKLGFGKSLLIGAAAFVSMFFTNSCTKPPVISKNNPTMIISNLQVDEQSTDLKVGDAYVSFGLILENATQANITVYGKHDTKLLEDYVQAEGSENQIQKHYKIYVDSYVYEFNIEKYPIRIEAEIPGKNPVTLKYDAELGAEQPIPIFGRHNPDLVNKLELLTDDIVNNGTLADIGFMAYFDLRESDSPDDRRILRLVSLKDTGKFNTIAINSVYGTGELIDWDCEQSTMVYYDTSIIYSRFSDFPEVKTMTDFLDIVGIEYTVTDKGILAPSPETLLEILKNETSQSTSGILEEFKIYHKDEFYFKTGVYYFDGHTASEEPLGTVQLIYDQSIESIFAYSKDTGNIVAVTVGTDNEYFREPYGVGVTIYQSIFYQPRGPPSFAMQHEELGDLRDFLFVIKTPTNDYYRVSDMPTETASRVIDGLDAFEQHINEIFGE